jgi:hypothetical protein
MSRLVRQSLGRIFAAPAIVALASAAGLTGALVGDGLWDLLSCLGLAVPALLFLACLLLGRRGRTG